MKTQSSVTDSRTGYLDGRARLMIWPIIISGLTIAAVLARKAMYSNFFPRTADNIYSFEHIVFELSILMAGNFLIADAWISIRRRTKRSFDAQLPCYLRLAIGISILVVHITVLVLGGYKQ